MCKGCGGFINSGDIPKEEIAPDNWCYMWGKENGSMFKECDYPLKNANHPGILRGYPK